MYPVLHIKIFRIHGGFMEYEVKFRKLIIKEISFPLN